MFDFIGWRKFFHSINKLSISINHIKKSFKKTFHFTTLLAGVPGGWLFVRTGRILKLSCWCNLCVGINFSNAGSIIFVLKELTRPTVKILLIVVADMIPSSSKNVIMSFKNKNIFIFV
jgi:hypothetical protein